MLMNLGNYFLDFKVSSMFSRREPLSSPKGVNAEPRRSWPLARRKRQPLAALCPFAPFHHFGCASCCRRQQASPADFTGSFVVLGGLRQKPAAWVPRRAQLPFHTRMQWRCFYRRARLSAGLVLRQGDSPALRSAVILAREISVSTRSSSPPVVPCHRFKPCKLFLTVNKTSQEPTWKTGFPQTLRPFLFLPEACSGYAVTVNSRAWQKTKGNV